MQQRFRGLIGHDGLQSMELLNEEDLWWKLTGTMNHVHTEVKFKHGVYEVEVFFKNSNGSSIFAKAHDSDRLHAMVKCLQEIDRLK